VLDGAYAFRQRRRLKLPFRAYRTGRSPASSRASIGPLSRRRRQSCQSGPRRMGDRDLSHGFARVTSVSCPRPHGTLPGKRAFREQWSCCTCLHQAVVVRACFCTHRRPLRGDLTRGPRRAIARQQLSGGQGSASIAPRERQALRRGSQATGDLDHGPERDPHAPSPKLNQELKRDNHHGHPRPAAGRCSPSQQGVDSDDPGLRLRSRRSPRPQLAAHGPLTDRRSAAVATAFGASCSTVLCPPRGSAAPEITLREGSHLQHAETPTWPRLPKKLRRDIRAVAGVKHAWANWFGGRTEQAQRVCFAARRPMLEPPVMDELVLTTGEQRRWLGDKRAARSASSVCSPNSNHKVGDKLLHAARQHLSR
jgi:hypothetical protein